MRTLRRRRFRRPILGRLAWAWLAFAAASAVAAGLVLFIGDRWPGRIALPVEGEAEQFAPPLARGDGAEAPASAGRQAADITLAGGPRLRDGAISPPEDVFATPYEYAPFGERDDAHELLEPAEEPLGEVVITVDGRNVDEPNEAPKLAQHAPAAIRIPDPDPALLQDTLYGKAPRIGPGGLAAYRAYARPFDPGDDRPRIAIVVGGLGLNKTFTERAIEQLPPEATLAFAPYADDLEIWAAKARRAGHEIAIELPMEGYGGDPSALGSAALLTTRTTKQNLQRLDWILSRFGAYFAATNYQGGKFSADTEAMAPVLERLRDMGVAYIDDTGAARRTARKIGGQWTIVNRVIAAAGAGDSRGMLREDLEALERIARRDGEALGKTYAYEANLEEIESWAKDIEARGLTLAPASAVLRARAATR